MTIVYDYFIRAFYCRMHPYCTRSTSWLRREARDHIERWEGEVREKRLERVVVNFQRDWGINRTYEERLELHHQSLILTEEIRLLRFCIWKMKKDVPNYLDP